MRVLTCLSLLLISLYLITFVKCDEQTTQAAAGPEQGPGAYGPAFVGNKPNEQVFAAPVFIPQQQPKAWYGAYGPAAYAAPAPAAYAPAPAYAPAAFAVPVQPQPQQQFYAPPAFTQPHQQVYAAAAGPWGYGAPVAPAAVAYGPAVAPHNQKTHYYTNEKGQVYQVYGPKP